MAGLVTLFCPTCPEYSLGYNIAMDMFQTPFVRKLEGGIILKIKECDDRKLTIMLKKLPLVSMQLGHANALGTVRDFIVSSNDSVEIL